MRRSLAARSIPGLMLLMLLLPLVAFSAEADASEDLSVAIDMADMDRPWLVDDTDLVLDVALVNTGSTALDLTIDPSCGLVLSLVEDGLRTLDGAASCRGQQRGLHLEADERGLEAQLTLNATALDLPSGQHTLEVREPISGVASTVLVEVRRATSWPEHLALELLPIQRSNASEDGEVLLLRWRNTGSEAVFWPSESCSLHLVDAGWEELSSCTGAREALAPWEVRLAGALPVSHASVGADGLVRISTPNGEAEASYTPLHADLPPAETSLDIRLPSTSPAAVSSGMIVEPLIDLVNAGNEDVPFQTSTTCRTDWWAVDASGRIVYDSRWVAPCFEATRTTSLGAGSTTTFLGLGWGLIDGTGCTVPSGVYALVGRADALDVTGTTLLNVEHEANDGCAVAEDLLITTSIVEGQDGLPALTVEVTGPADGAEIVLQGTCAGFLRLLDDDAEVMLERAVGCGGRHARHYNLPDAEAVLRLDLGSVDLHDGEGGALPSGAYLVEVELKAGSPIQHRSVIMLSSSTEATLEEAEAPPVVEAPILTEEGVWTGLQTSEGACWLLQVDSDRFLSLAEGPTSWSPTQGQRGQYLVQATVPSSACVDVDAEGITVLEVLDERTPTAAVEPEPTPATAAESTLVEADGGIVPEVVPIVAVAVASTSVIGLLVGLVLTNEGWRLPASTAGLWMLGLMGRTKETSDGRFQRGRIMGYLEANPGCHFRALMNALDLSNGQAAHHLRVLEREERLWRRQDGRLVRLYPLMPGMHPETPDEDLPVPPLSPDPNSLQGRILALLDDDGLMGDFPTQADLARRLERSQQIVSHHLRTLERYGLVEKRKMGVRQRYVLTREAVFLLERGDGQQG